MATIFPSMTEEPIFTNAYSPIVSKQNYRIPRAKAGVSHTAVDSLCQQYYKMIHNLILENKLLKDVNAMNRIAL